MKKFLLAIDFSEGLETVYHYATEMAQRQEAELHLFHSYFDKILMIDNSFPSGIDTDSLINKKIIQEIKLQAEKEMQSLQRTLAEKYPQMNIRYTVKGGVPDEEILSCSETYKPNLIIMGSSGKGKKRILSGSVSRKIMSKSSVPVLSIPLQYTYKDFKNILYLTEFDIRDKEIIQKLFGIFDGYQMKIHCLHLNQKEDTESSEKMTLLRRQLKKQENAEIVCFDLIDSSDINMAIEKYVMANNIDLIAFLSHKRNIFQEFFTHKITKKNLYQANIPLLAFKDD